MLQNVVAAAAAAAESDESKESSDEEVRRVHTTVSIRSDIIMLTEMLCFMLTLAESCS